MHSMKTIKMGGNTWNIPRPVNGMGFFCIKFNIQNIEQYNVI